MGLGGKTTALGVRINVKQCHIASLPVAVNIQCHSARYKEVIF
jgi:fumarate hydratase subunit alpha